MARCLINPHGMTYLNLGSVAKTPERIPERLNGAGITAMMDALAARAQFYDPSRTRTADNQIDNLHSTAACARGPSA